MLPSWLRMVAVVTLGSLLCVAPVRAATQNLLLVGDSLSAAYGIDPSQGWATLLQARLDKDGYDYRVINASISGDTTANGLARLPALLESHKPRVVIIELGANDGLRGLPLQNMKHNITAMVRAAQADGATVLLVGMRLPPNYGPRYTRAFEQVYAEVAREQALALVPFLLDGMATDFSLVQRDTLHPTAAAQPHLLDNVWPHLKPLL
jgi:acyl-CoA thioesterase-1